MQNKSSKRLVIDSDVVQSAGGEKAKDPTSKNCRYFLLAVLRICHRVVITPEILDEWKRHRSGFARTWCVSMNARKKIEYFKATEISRGLRAKIEKLNLNNRDSEAMLKDIKFLEAALAADKIVISREEESRRLFTKASQSLKELKDVIWVNPDKNEEQAVFWLEEGAKPDQSRSLGFPRENL